MKATTVPRIAATCVLLASTLATLQAEVRTYKSNDGKELQADVVAVRDGKASLKVASGKVYTVPLERLSEADQTFLKAWGEKNPTYALNDLRLEVRKSRKPVKKDGEQGTKKDKRFNNRFANISWKGYIQNNTRSAIEGIKVNYTVYVRDYTRNDSGTFESLKEITGDDDVGSIDGGDKYEFESKLIEEVSKSDKGDKENKPTTERQSVVGAVFKVSVKGRELFTHEDPSGIVAKLEAEAERERAKEARELEKDR